MTATTDARPRACTGCGLMVEEPRRFWPRPFCFACVPACCASGSAASASPPAPPVPTQVRPRPQDLGPLRRTREHVVVVSSEWEERYGERWWCARVEGYPDVWRRERDRAIGVAQSQVFEEAARVARELLLFTYPIGFRILDVEIGR